MTRQMYAAVVHNKSAATATATATDAIFNPEQQNAIFAQRQDIRVGLRRSKMRLRMRL
jgi:hypothetical protein